MDILPWTRYSSIFQCISAGGGSVGEGCPGELEVRSVFEPWFHHLELWFLSFPHFVFHWPILFFFIALFFTWNSCPSHSFLYCFSYPLEYVLLVQKLCCAWHIVGAQYVSWVNEWTKYLLQGCHACCMCRSHNLSHALQPFIRITSCMGCSSGSGDSRRHKPSLFCRLSGILKTILVQTLLPTTTPVLQIPNWASSSYLGDFPTTQLQ